MIQKTGLSDLPPFPTDVPTAPIARISLSKILDDDPSESKAVLEACRNQGFFYLDLRLIDQGERLIKESEDLLEVSRKVFDHPFDYKNQHALIKGSSLFGFKEAGTVKKTDSTQRPDSTEFFNCAKDHMHDFTPSRSYPPEIVSSKPLLASFQKNAHDIGMLMLSTLAKQLDISPSELTDKNIFTKPSGDHCRLTCKPAHPPNEDALGLPSHTDFGSITILFNWLGGLQIQSQDPAKQGEWAYVKPLEGHAIVNLGDAMVTFTNGMLKSAKHRVVPSPGEQCEVDRYSVVYFVRPHNEALMQPCEKFKGLNDNLKVAGKFEPQGVENGRVLTAGEWMLQRAIQMGS